MKNREVEKMLKEKAKRLPDLPNVNEELGNESKDKVYRIATRRFSYGKLAVAACSLLFATAAIGGSVFMLNKNNLKQENVVLSAQQSGGEIKAQLMPENYLKEDMVTLDGEYDVFSSHLFYDMEDDDNFYKTLTNLKELEGTELKDVPLNHLETEVKLRSSSAMLEYDYVKSGESYLYWQTMRDSMEESYSEESEDSTNYESLTPINETENCITLYGDDKTKDWSYVAKYDIETQTATDVLAGIMIDGVEIYDEPVLSDWDWSGSAALSVKVGTDKTLYMIDFEKKEAINVAKETGIDNPTSAELSNGILYVKVQKDTSYSLYRYNVEKKELSTIYEEATKWSGEGTKNGSVLYLNMQYDIAKINNQIYLIDKQNSNKVQLQGISEEVLLCSMINISGTKILACNSTREEAWIIDITKGECYKCNLDALDEKTTFCWTSDTEFIVLGLDLDNQKTKVITYTLTEE